MSNVRFIRDKTKVASLDADGHVQQVVVLPSISQAKRYTRLNCMAKGPVVRGQFKTPPSVVHETVSCKREVHS